MSRYAADTTVSVEKSRAEIEATLKRYKAESFAYASEGRKAAIQFRIAGRVVKFILTLPDPNADEFNVYMQGNVKYRRKEGVPEKMWEQACRQRWRALALVIKAKLEAVSAGITTIEDEFLAHTMLPDGTTFGQWAKPQIDKAYEIGAMPKHLALEGPAA